MLHTESLNMYRKNVFYITIGKSQEIFSFDILFNFELLKLQKRFNHMNK